MVIQLTVDQSCAQGRGGFGEERYETTDFQSQVRKMYNTLEEQNSDVSYNLFKYYDHSDQLT